MVFKLLRAAEEPFQNRLRTFLCLKYLLICLRWYTELVLKRLKIVYVNDILLLSALYSVLKRFLAGSYPVLAGLVSSSEAAL